MKQGSAFSKDHLKDNIATLYEGTPAVMQGIGFLFYGFFLTKTGLCGLRILSGCSSQEAFYEGFAE